MHRVTVFLVVAVAVTLALGTLLGVGYLMGLGLNAVGMASHGFITWGSVTAVAIMALILDRGFRRWWSANSTLASAIASAFTAGCAYAHWAETGSMIALWIGRITAIIAIILFLRYSCRWGNWCADVGPWWENTAWPAIKRGWRQVWGWSRVIVRRYVVPFIVGMFQAFRPWAERNFWLLLSIGFGLWAYYLYRDSRDWNEQSNWFWVVAGASFVAFLAWSSFTRRWIAGFVHWVIELFESGFLRMWARFSTETSSFGKALTATVAFLGIAIVSSFWQEVFHRNTGWLFQWLHINMYSFDRITWSGVALSAAVSTVAVVVLMLILPDLWPKKKSATPAAPARPAPPSNAAARAAAAERHARRAARQARVDFLRANP